MSDQPIRKSNPIRDSKNRIKLGVFGINGNGAAFTFHPDRFKCTWDANVRLAQKAEKLGLEGFVSAAHWKSFGGDNHYSGDLMETFAWAGGIAAVTERIGIISTIHVTLIHPVFAAKAEATVDLISKGRAGLNLVLGWYPPDMQLWGLDVKEHGDRFAKCLESMSDADLGTRVELPGGSKTRFEMILGVKEHEMHHRAQLFLVERLIGIVPHLTRQRQERMAQQAKS